jgi:hypothetical protein
MRQKKANVSADNDKPDFRRTLPESWQCIDCGRNTAPGIKNRAQTEQAFQIQKLMWNDGGVSMELNDESEVYHLRDAVWKAGMAPFGGCLCIGCLEKRLGRQLGPKDFDCLQSCARNTATDGAAGKTVQAHG